MLKTISENLTGAAIGGGVGAAGGAVGGALLGGVVGTFILPGIGTLAGALLGAVTGAIISGLGGAALGAIVSDWFTGVAHELEPSLDSIDEGAEKTGKTVTDLSEVFGNLDNTLTETDIDGSLGDLSDTFGDASIDVKETDIGGAAAELDDALDNAGDIIFDGGNDIGDQVTETGRRFGKINEGIPPLGERLNEAFEGILDGLTLIKDKIWEGVTSFQEVIERLFEPYEEQGYFNDTGQAGARARRGRGKGGSQPIPDAKVDVIIHKDGTRTTGEIHPWIQGQNTTRIQLEELQ